MWECLTAGTVSRGMGGSLVQSVSQSVRVKRAKTPFTARRRKAPVGRRAVEGQFLRKMEGSNVQFDKICSTYRQPRHPGAPSWLLV